MRIWAAGIFAVHLLMLAGAASAANLDAAFTSNVTCGSVDFNVQFNDKSTGDSITDYYWEFSNTSTTETSDLQDANHTFTVEGMYTVRHSVTNASGTAWSNQSKYIRAVPEWRACVRGSVGGGASQVSPPSDLIPIIAAALSSVLFVGRKP